MSLRFRKDTIDDVEEKRFLDPNKQQFICTLGRRGQGKSYLSEALIEKYYKAGFTVLDLWSAPNLENAFWCIAKDGINKDGQPYKKRYPVTIIASESYIYPDEEIRSFNARFNTRVPLVKIVKIPTPTAKAESENNDKIREIITEIILECRRYKRIFVFNPKMFPNETAMFRTLEAIVRELTVIAFNHFNYLRPEKCIPPKQSRKEMTNQEKSWHKMVFLIREFGELAPAREKGDKSGQSTLIKKAILKMVRLARHDNISGILDYQNSSDVVSSVRSQIDVWLIKKWTDRLAGDEFKWVFERIDVKRRWLLEKYNYTKKAKRLANDRYPPIEKMGKKWYYAITSNDTPGLKRVPELGFQHKEPHQNWSEITGIPIKFDKELVAKTNGTVTQKASKNEEIEILLAIHQRRYPTNKKKKEWNDVRLELAESQKKGEILWKQDFESMPTNTCSKLYKRLLKKHPEKVTEK